METVRYYLQTLEPEIRAYFKILSPEGIPEFLHDYIYLSIVLIL